MTIEVNGKTIETDEEGYLINPDDWDENIAEALIKQHEAAGHKQVTETDWRLINYFREYYENHMKHPSMNHLLQERAKLHNEHFEDEKTYKKFLFDLFPHGPVRMLCKLSGLPNPKDEIEA